MNIRKLPPVVLAVFLQFAPVIKLFQASPLLAAMSPIAIVLRWAVGVAAAVGAYHTVTGASAAIAGMVKMTNSPTGPKTAGPLTNNAVEPGGQPFFYRILVTNPGSDHQLDFWNVTPTPPGLGINTNIGGNGWITNVPGQVTVVGVYPVTLIAGNQACNCQVTLPATITITGGGGSSPVITNPPASSTVLLGGNAVFAVGASGAAPLSYQWLKDGATMNGRTSSSLVLSNVSGTDAAGYSARVSNSAGTNTSQSAVLTVVSQPALTATSQAPNLLTLSFTTQPTAAYALESASAGTTNRAALIADQNTH